MQVWRRTGEALLAGVNDAAFANTLVSQVWQAFAIQASSARE